MNRLVLGILLLSACAGERRFPIRDPIWRDGDLEARNVPCRPDPKKPGHQLCRPEVYESSFAWDGADNLAFRPLAKLFEVRPAGEAVNVNSYDEVPDSSWFTNRVGRRPMTPAELTDGPCGDRLDGDAPDGAWLIDQGKANGANPGFRVRLPDGRRYMLKTDVPLQPEKQTAATAIATRLYHAAGWYAPCDTIVYVRRSVLRLSEGLTITDNYGKTRPLDGAELERLLADASRRDDRIRFVASRWLPGRPLGPFTYAGLDEDDPADVVAHEDRRELRGARLMAAWLNHWDSREQNSMRVWLSDDARDPDASPGRVLHYHLDFGDCFGADWGVDAITRRLGQAYYLDPGYLAADFFSLGLVERPWHRAQRHEVFAYFSARDFDPAAWVGNYPNPAFGRMSERDGAWAARIIARFSDELIAEAVRAGDFTNPAHAAFLAEQLRGRRDVILRRYLGKLSPITDLAVEGDQLCGVDLARRSGVFAASSFHYDAGGAPVSIGTDGRICVRVPRQDGYRVLEIRNGQARGPLRAHLHDLGASGLLLVGIERSSS